MSLIRIKQIYQLQTELDKKLTDVSFNANTILKADSDNTPIPLVIPEQTILGRKISGSIDALVSSDVRSIIGISNLSDILNLGNNSAGNNLILDPASTPTDNSFANSSDLIIRSKYDSDPTANITVSNFDTTIRTVVTSAGASPQGYADILLNGSSLAKFYNNGSVALQGIIPSLSDTLYTKNLEVQTNAGIGVASSATSRLIVKGLSTSGTYSAKFQNSNGLDVFTIMDDRALILSSVNAGILYLDNNSSGRQFSIKALDSGYHTFSIKLGASLTSLITTSSAFAMKANLRFDKFGLTNYIYTNNGGNGFMVLGSNSGGVGEAGISIGDSGRFGIGIHNPSLLESRLHVVSPILLSKQPAWGVNGVFSRFDASTFEDTDITGTRTTAVANSYAVPTFTSTNIVTITDAANFYIAGAPTAGTNMTITNAYSLWIAAGDVRIDSGVVVGSPTGGSKGNGTINAQAVYDDNVLLTDYVFDFYFDRKINNSDISLMPDLAKYRRYDIEETYEFVKENRHLPTIIGREEWKKEKASIGKLTSQLWETIENQFIYIHELKEELKTLKNKLNKL